MRQIGRNNTYTIEEIRKYLLEYDLGIELISEEYKNSRTKLEFKCNYCEFEFCKLFKDIQTRGKGCPSCSQNDGRIPLREMREKISKCGYEIASEITGNIRRGSEFTVKCPNGHTTETTWKIFNNNQILKNKPCKDCMQKVVVKNGKTREDYIKEYTQNIEEWGYTYKGSIVSRSSDRRTFICNNGHERSLIYGALKDSPECPECKGVIKKHTVESISKILEEVGMQYINGFTTVKEIINIKCHCGAETFGYLYDLVKSKVCRECNDIKKTTFQEKLDIYHSNGCTLLEIRMKQHREPSMFKCKCGNIDSKTWDTYKRHPFCKECGKKNKARGENHPCWNPNLTDEERLKSRKYPEYKEWRLSVYERDNYTCQCCGDSKGGNLEAHHILNHSQYRELRLDINNGITLCNTCHVGFHMTYGFTDNNREQLNEYLINK